MGERVVGRGAARFAAAWLPERTGLDIGYIVSILMVSIKNILLLMNLSRGSRVSFTLRTRANGRGCQPREQVFGIRTARVVVNALRTQALDAVYLFEAPELAAKRSESNSVNSQNRNDLEGNRVIGWVSGTIFEPGSCKTQPERTDPSPSSESPTVTARHVSCVDDGLCIRGANLLGNRACRTTWAAVPAAEMMKSFVLSK